MDMARADEGVLGLRGELYEASEQGDRERVKRLLSGCRASVLDTRERSVAMTHSATRGHVDCVDLLLKSGADVNHANIFGESTLMATAKNGHYDVLGVLLKSGANVNDKGGNGWLTALTSAAVNGHVECVDLLLKSGANVNETVHGGETALMKAAKRGHGQCVEVLVRSGAEVNQTDNNGASALMAAAENGQHRCMNLLIKLGADVNHLSKCEVTVFVEALKAGAKVKGLVKAPCQEEQALSMAELLISSGASTVQCVDSGILTSRYELVTDLKFDRSLKNLCRWMIRRHLLSVNHVNLLITVPKLGLPTRLKDYVLDVPFKQTEWALSSFLDMGITTL